MTSEFTKDNTDHFSLPERVPGLVCMSIFLAFVGLSTIGNQSPRGLLIIGWLIGFVLGALLRINPRAGARTSGAGLLGGSLGYAVFVFLRSDSSSFLGQLRLSLVLRLPQLCQLD
jgi:hypothetical protein